MYILISINSVVWKKEILKINTFKHKNPPVVKKQSVNKQWNLPIPTCTCHVYYTVKHIYSDTSVIRFIVVSDVDFYFHLTIFWTFFVGIDRMSDYMVQETQEKVKLEWKSTSASTLKRMTRVRIREGLLFNQYDLFVFFSAEEAWIGLTNTIYGLNWVDCVPLAQTEFAIFKDSNDAFHKASEQCYIVKEGEGFRWKQKKCGDDFGAICEQRILGILNNAHQNSSCFIFMYIFNSKDKAQWYASCHCNKYGHLWTLSMYRLVNLSRAPWDLVPGEAMDHIEWRVKGLPTYLVHGSHKIFVFCVSIYFLKFFYNPKYFINSILMTGNFFWAKSRNFCNCDKNLFSFWLFKE